MLCLYLRAEEERLNEFSVSYKSTIHISDIVFLFFSVFAFLVAYVVGESEATIAILFVVSLVVLYMSDISRLSDPRVLITGFFFLYQTWFPLKIIFFGDSYMHKISSDKLSDGLLLSLFAYVVIANILNFMVRQLSNGWDSIYVHFERERLSEKIVFFFSCILGMASIVSFITSGVTSKREILDGYGALSLFSYICMVFITVNFLLRMARSRRGRFFEDGYVCVSLGIIVLYTGVAGERDVLFRAIVCLAIIYYEKSHSFGYTKFFIMLVAAAFVVPFSQLFKSVFLVGLQDGSWQDVEIFGNEFISASRNLHYLLEFGVDHSWLHLLNDLLRAIVPSVLLPGLSVESTSSWYNGTYRVVHGFDGTSGWGFGLVAEGYLVAGYFGVFVVTAICTTIVGLIYRVRLRSSHHFVLYILSLTVFIYVLRADVANFISQIFKIFGVCFLVFFVANLLMRKA